MIRVDDHDDLDWFQGKGGKSTIIIENYQTPKFQIPIIYLFFTEKRFIMEFRGFWESSMFRIIAKYCISEDAS